ncbi:hypothetical protein [Dyadobacter sp. NIV53]|uniref:hypothetical protein n=1 Tax=Dyadobacter sp. NIV53 TaxID=2861765 RepID=UPI001C87BB57|nr:hypothetical protein [Dyadobacter sp. NIV53]
MKSIILAVAIMFSCSKYIPLRPENIASIHPVFKDTTSNHFLGYRLTNGIVVKYDGRDTYVKQYLSENLGILDSIEKDADIERFTKVILNKKTFKPIPIPVKALPFKEFGYIKTKEGEIIFYGLPKDGFVDLTSNRVYY